MKLATFKNNTRDGQLVVVSKDLSSAVAVPDIALTLQFALDHWKDCEAKLQNCYEKLNQGIIGIIHGDPVLSNIIITDNWKFSDKSNFRAITRWSRYDFDLRSSINKIRYIQNFIESGEDSKLFYRSSKDGDLTDECIA